MFGNLSLAGKITAASGLISIAGQLLARKGPIWDGIQAIRDSSLGEKTHQLMELIKRSDNTGQSLAQYTQQLRIVNRVFVDSSVAEEAVLPNLLRALRGWYTAQCLAGLQLQQLVSKGVSVQDVLGVVQTGDNPHYHNAGISAFQRFAGMTSLVECFDHIHAADLSQEAWIPPSGSHSDPQVQALLKKAMAAAAGSTTAKLGANLMDVMQNAAAQPDGQSVLQGAWAKAIDIANSKNGSKVVDKAVVTATAAAMAMAGLGIKKMAQAGINKVSPDNMVKLEADLKKAKTKEELVGIAEKYHLDRRLVEKKIAELNAPINIDPQRVDLEKINGIATGELFNVTLTNPADKDASITVPLMIQMTPINVPYRVAPRFIDGMVSPSIWQRWTQFTAGELDFFSDFLGQSDRLSKRIDHGDDEGLRALKTFLSSIQRKDAYSVNDVASHRNAGQMSQNLANSVMVFSEDTVRNAYAESGIDLNNDKDRERYFAATYVMIVAIVDPAFAEVNVYIRGIDGKINFKFSALKPADKKFDPVDLIAAISALGSGKAPSIR